MYLVLYVLLKALSPVCMKYTAQDKSHLSQDSHQELYTFIQMKWQCFIVFTLTKVSQNTGPWSF